MMLVHIEEDGEEICELVELYDLRDSEDNLPYGRTINPVWCRANIMSAEELTMAFYDVQRDGINRWFYENGTFKLTPMDISTDVGPRHEWDWAPNETTATPDDNEAKAAGAPGSHLTLLG